MAVPPRRRGNNAARGVLTCILGAVTLVSALLLLPSATAVGSCFEDPAQAVCKDAETYYQTALVNADLDALCESRPFASACSIRRRCQAGSASGQFCEPWSLLHSACAATWGETMGDLPQCSKFKSLCAPTLTAVAQCSRMEGVPHLVSTDAASSAVQALCTEMPGMSDCKKCALNVCPDPLQTLSDLCLSMPMGGCNGWTAMCDSHPDGLEAYCGADTGGTCSGVMEMYFHTGMQDYVLFKGWVPCSPGRYWLSLLAITLASTAVGFVKAFRLRLEHRWSVQEDGMSEGLLGGQGSETDQQAAAPRTKSLDSVGYLPETRQQWRENAARGLLSGFVLFLDYALMLLAMTFNIGIILAVVAGNMLGTLLFGHNARMFGQRSGHGVLDERECCASA
mmetsp:Transcript_22791/g.56278  ORF Transcript_22791/g.56278 Transcript_22791/m.56278 type:complete len:395 (-) Transcript_22791:220-1404(-)|eukprot:CAMPEP_0206247592 /NCGR_PEP_ID=MMETSP0047_2-20121206/19897_1 /ASSEMBLY_ACC=CAM_ASM_000192 /TAXON_ID=195065 /ORGANISM="Chroomonas mesostigmatica_cf, Strain CCMP1168" /LENGTH=394 /DNA_ID=CAMNT_0053673137 /DNA_START=37 /DNA_END=1221 /DNA_ORIENTATION=+